MRTEHPRHGDLPTTPSGAVGEAFPAGPGELSCGRALLKQRRAADLDRADGDQHVAQRLRVGGAQSNAAVAHERLVELEVRSA